MKMRHFCGVKLLNRFAMNTQILSLTLIILTCIVESQDVSVSDKLIVFQGYVVLSGGVKVTSDKDRDYRATSFVPIDVIIDNGVLPIDILDIMNSYKD